MTFASVRAGCLFTLALALACSPGTSPSVADGGHSGSPNDQVGVGGSGPAAGGFGSVMTSAGGAPAGGSAIAGASAGGGAPSSGGAGGGIDSAGSAATLQGPGTYALPPPSRCHNQDYIDFQEGCKDGDATSVCGGKCNTINACQESTAEKPHADVTFICPRFMLFSTEMQQAAIDDGNANFNYAVVGHDVDRGGIDGDANSTCCQCYELVYAYPSPSNERQVLSDPDHPDPPSSAIPLPKPLIVQSFNTAATPTTFDVYMAAGGFGANNACAPNLQPQARSGKYLYTSYPADGQPSQGGVKPVTLYSECKTDKQWVTAESLSSDACRSKVTAACSKLASDIPGLTEQAQRSCLATTDPSSQYHMNWAVYAMKVECPQHLTQVTGCKLAPQGLPEVDRSVTSSPEPPKNPGFRSKSSSGRPYETTTMEDCCRPSCASKDWVSGRGLASDPDYDAFYSCDGRGVPFTE
ncbi:MAG TPA: hypothetical protein VFK05_31515 [Polyangiaceae bacterium]|nr:hypothetical protein [Polyangiaceae bacterium]